MQVYTIAIISQMCKEPKYQLIKTWLNCNTKTTQVKNYGIMLNRWKQILGYFGSWIVEGLGGEAKHMVTFNIFISSNYYQCLSQSFILIGYQIQIMYKTEHCAPMKRKDETKQTKGKAGKQDVDTYHIQKILYQATETHTVPIHLTIWIHIIFKIIKAQTTTNRTHYSSYKISFTSFWFSSLFN